MMKIQSQQQDLKDKYWDGWLNFGCRLWFYFIRGVEILDKFKYLLIIIGGCYFLKKIPLFVAVIAMVIAIIVIFLVGMFSVHRLGKVLDYLNVKFSTHYSSYNIELLEKILTELEKLNAKNPTHKA